MVEKGLELKIGHYQVGVRKKLGSGAFGDVFYGVNLKTNEEVAVKVESAKTKQPQLPIEKNLLQFLKDGEGFPRVHCFLATKEYNFMIIDLLGPSIDDLFTHFKFKLNKFTVLKLAIQMIERLEFLHSRHIIHRDIKPDNFLIGLKLNKNKCYLVDFGLAKQFRDSKTGEHIKYKDGKSLTGTARYASIFTHLGIEQSRRDDLECLGYCIVYLFKGSLPWQGLKAKNQREKYLRISDVKIEHTPYKLCQDMPKEFLQFFEYVRALIFEEIPDYNYLKNLFIQLLNRNNVDYESDLEWNTTHVDVK